MNFIAIFTVVFALAITPVCAFAGENAVLVKGSKSYQKPDSSSSEESSGSDDQSQASPAEDPQDISPAAGAEEQDTETTGEALQESMKLPRK